MEPQNINIRMTPEDFHTLSGTKSRWVAGIWEQTDRFEPTLTSESHEYKFAHWVDTYSAALLARSFLEAIGEKVSVYWDMGMLNYVLLTNYPYASWSGE